MKFDQLTPDQISRAVLSATDRVPAARRCAVQVMIDGKPTDAAVVNVTSNALGVILWAES